MRDNTLDSCTRAESEREICVGLVMRGTLKTNVRGYDMPGPQADPSSACTTYTQEEEVQGFHVTLLKVRVATKY